MNDIVIVGSGGLAKEVKYLIDELNRQEEKWNLLGLISMEPAGTYIDDVEVIGNDEWLLKCDKSIGVLVCIGNGKKRKQLIEKYKDNPNLYFPSIIAPNTVIGDDVVMGEGCIILFTCVLTVNIRVGDFVICNYLSSIGHDTRIENFVTLLPGSRVSGNVVLKYGSSVGAGAVILPNISIGRNAFVGAGATVVRDVDDDTTVVGVPAKPLIK